MNSSWSDQDRSRESDLTTPDSHSGTSEGEFESFEDGGHHANENNLDYEDPHSDEMDADGLQTNYNQSTEAEAGEDASNTSEHLPHPEAAGEEEAGGVREMLEDSGEALGGSGGPRTDENGEKRHTVLNMHHVDLILDNIDAELNDIINRSLNSEHSEHSYHGNSTSSGQTRSSKRSQKSAMLINSATESSDSETAEGTLEEGSATDTGLGTGSHPGDSSPLPNGENAHHRSSQNVALDRMRQNSNSKKPRKKRIPQRQVVVEFSDVDSICSEDVRMRVEETLHLQDSDKDAPPSQRSHGPSHSHDALQKYYRSPPSDPALNNAQSPYGVCRIPDQMPSDKNEVTSPSDDNNETEEISSRIQKMVSQVLSDSTSDPLFEEVPPPNHDKESLSQNLPITNQDSLRTTSAKNSDGQGGARQPLAPTSQSFLENRRAGRGFDADSIATEDFERVFQKSIVYHEPSSMTSSTPRRTIHNNPSNSNPIKKLATPPPLKKTDRLTVPGMGKRGKSRNRKKRTVTLPASKPSGLPEYMYLRKGVTESDVGSDSIRTEDYEGHFEAARVTDQHNSPKYANLSNLSRGRHTAIVQSDPESIQTEEYEQRFRSLMVKQVAGVPVKSFDQVTIPSDLESVETGMVHQKFQEALRKGPEVRVFNEFGDQSNLDPLQMEEIERKFQAILRKKKIEKIRHSPKEGDTEDEGTSDLDSVRAIPSKSEAGSPPTRQSLNGRSQGRRHQNGAHIKHSGRSGDPSPRASAFNSSRSSSRVPSSPIRSQLTSPWSTPRDISPSPPTQRSPTAVGVHPHFPFGQLVAAKPCPNHEKKNPARTDKPNFPSWQDPSVGRQRAAAWNAQRQDSFSTYEEVESLHSHQCSSLQSLDNSCCPSRLQSFGSTSSSLDQSHPQVDGGPWTGGIPTEEQLQDCQHKDQGSSLTSDSTQSASAEGGRSGHLKGKSRRSLIEDDEDEMNSSVAKWVDQTRAETARRRSHVGLPEDPPVRSHEAPEGGQQSSALSKERSLTALNMQCGDVIPGRSGRRMRLPNETDLELALRVESTSPVSMISRCASVDSSHSSTGSDHHPEGEWTIAENVLINLGFGGASIGIPNRFLKSWRQQVVKQRMEEVRRLLGNTTGNHLLQHLPAKPERALSPKEKSPPARKEDWLSQSLSQPSTSVCSPKSSSINATGSEGANSHQMEDAVMSRQRGADKAKLAGLRRSLRKAATVSSFGQTLSEISKQGPPNHQVLALQQGDQPPAARRSPGGGKYSPFHKSHKSSSRDRRRKYMKRQSSLPISLETLQEEDESLKPGMVKSKQTENEIPSAQKHLLKPQSLEVGDEPAFHCKLKIVMEQPSVESREAMSRQGTTDVDVDEAIADVDTDKKDHKVSMEQYLVVKAIIDSKDSGFENEPSRTGSPQISPRSSEDETVRGTCSTTVTTAESKFRKARSGELLDSKSDSLLVTIPSKELGITSKSGLLTSPIKSFQSQLNSQKELPDKEELPVALEKSTPDTSDAHVSSELLPQTDMRDTKVKGRSFSSSSERRGPSLADIQDDFHLTIIEDEDDDNVFDSPGGSVISESVSACCQTSPTLHSPLLSPLSFLGSISEHSDGHSSSPEIFVMPSSSTVAAVEENHDSHMERRDSLESVMTTADGLVSDLPLRNLSQEISDGGLSIITEKEEEQGASQEPSDQVSIMDMTSQDNQDIPHTADNNKNSGNAGQNLFHYEDLHQNFGTFEQLASNPIEKSRNPFKMADSFYSSPHHSNVDFDFDATIEEDEDGEQYSDGESFSKVTFSEVTPMAYETSDLGMMPAAEHIDNNAHSKESQDSFSHLPMDEDSPDAQSAQLEKTEVKKEISSESLEDKSVAGVNSTGSCLQDNTNSDWEGFVCDDATKSGNLRAPSDAVILNKHPIPENDILNKAVVQPELVISTSDDGKSEEKFNTYEECNDHCPHNSHPGSYGICTSLKADEPSKDAKMCNPQGNESQLPSEGEFITDHIAHRGQDAANKPDRRILVGDTVHSENFKVSDSLTEGGLLQACEMKLTSAITNHFLALGPTEKGTKPLDQLQKERHTIEEWKLGLDQPQIMRSTSVEAHLSYQRRKLRTLSERSTLYSDGMEPLLSGFGRVITERSSSSTEGFGSLGSDIFRRPLTVTETLQQVAAKLESHVRQRSLVSIRDEEGEEENEQKMPAPEKPAIPGIKGSAELDSTGERNCVAPEQNWAHQMLDDEGYEEVNTRDENDIPVPIVDKATIKMSKNILVRKEAENSFKLLDKNMLQGNSACTATFSAVDTKVVGPNIQVDESSDDCKEVSKSDFTVLASTSADDFSGFTPKITTSSRRKSWQFQATTCRKSSNFLSVPSFGPLTDSISGNPLSASPSTTQLNSEVGLLQEMVPVTEETLEYSKSEGGRDQNMSVPSGFTDTGDVPQTADLQVSCDFVMGHVNDEKYQNSQDKSTVDLCTETGTEQEGQNKSAQAAEFMKETHSILKRSPQSILVSFDLVDDALGSCEKDLLSPLDCAEMHSQPDLVSPTGSSVSEVDIERIQPASDFVSVQVLPTSNSSPSQCGAVVHSQFYKCEKFMNVSTSSDGRIDFAEAGEDDSKTCKSHRILTFRSEVKIPSLSSAWQRFSAQPAWGGSMSCSQTGLSLDCPSPVPASRLSPTFEEICSKAGKLMQQLQDALASEAPGNQMSPAATESRDNMGTDENESQPGEEEGEVRRYRLAKPYSRENDNHHPGDAARIKLESKRRKKKLLWDGRVKTSTPKANPGGRHQGDSGREMEGDVEEGTNNDHLATVRELLETETKMRRKLDELESSFEEVSSRKQDALTDLKRLREAVHRNKRDIQKAEEIARENMERADGLRSELMVLEYQRDQARRDLEDLTKSIGSIKQSQSHRGTEEVNAGTGTNLLGLSPKEVIAVIKERDELKTRLRNGEGDLSPIERSELERQLNHTKQELFSGQKSSREKLESLQEELEESRHTIEELLVEKTNLAEKVKELQATVGSEHTDGMHSDIEERNLLLEQLSSKLQKELDALRHQTHEKDQRLQSLAASVSEKDKLNDALRDQVLAAQREAEEGQRETERVVREAQGKMRNADVAKELALVELREALLREKEEEIEQLKLSLEKDKKEALTALDQKTSEMMRITQRSLSEKEEDLNVVKMQLVQHTEEANKMEQQLREQAEEQVQAAVEKERRAMEEEYTRRRREENVEKELEVAKETSRLQGELHVTKQRLEQMQTTVGVLKEELDKLREENLAAGREKVEAVSEAREKAREDIQRELDQLREQLAKENLLEADKLRMKIRQQEEEVTRLRSEVKVHQDREAKSAGVTGSKSILAEINEECKRTAAVIGSAPLKMNISRGSKSLNGTRSPKSPLHGMPDSAQGPGRTQVMAALTNLRISNEELRNYVQSLKADLERQKRALSKAQKEKDEEVKKVASTIEKKSGDMDTMRDRLIQDHLVQVEELQQQISRQRTAEASLQQRLLDKDSELKEIQQSMTQWKEETALKMAKKFEEELSKELEIRLQEASKRDGSYRGSQADLRSRNSSGNGSPSTVSSASDASTIRLLRHLQERVKQLRSENMSLRRSSRGPFESSGEERASPHSSKHSESDDKDHLLYQLQQRVKLLERQLQVAEERCRENAASVSEKISENSRLQGALTQQTKELMKMERAYSKLASPTRTPVRL